MMLDLIKFKFQNNSIFLVVVYKMPSIKYKRLGTYDDSKRSGRLKKLDARDFPHLKRLVKGDARLNAKKRLRFEC